MARQDILLGLKLVKPAREISGRRSSSAKSDASIKNDVYSLAAS
jgi:hypothetical protein